MKIPQIIHFCLKIPEALGNWILSAGSVLKKRSDLNRRPGQRPSLKPGLKEVPKPGLKSENIPDLKEVHTPGMKFDKPGLKSTGKGSDLIGIPLFRRKKFLISLFVLIFISIPIGFLSLKNARPTVAAWFDDTFAYRQTVAITNSAGSTLTNQRIKITLDTATLITAGKMQSDCDDIRVTDNNGKLLDHWDTSCNTTSTFIYVKTLSLPTSGAVLYLYYGNPSATNVEKSLGSSDYPGTSCKMMKSQGSVTTDGVYYVVPGGNDTDKIQVYCDVTTLSEGWTLVLQNNGALTTNPEPVWNDAVNTVNTTGTFGSALTAFDLILGLKHWNYIGSTSMVQIGTAPTNITKRATYSSISLNTGNNYALSLGTETLYLGATTPGIKSYHAAGNYQFTTSDADNDVYSGNCANNYGGSPWWYGSCWSGSFWGGGDSGGYQNKPFWSGSSSDYNDYGAIFLGGTDTMKNVSSAAPTNEEKSAGPVAYWKFDEGYGTSTNDTTQDNYDGLLGSTAGTDAGAPTWTTEDQCLSGKCLYFDGTNDAVDFGDYDDLKALQFDTGNWSVSAWIRAPSGSSKRVVFGLRTGSDQDFHIGIDTSNRAYVEWVSYPSKPAYTTTTSSSTVADNKWHQIAAKREGGTITLYVDGVSVGTDSTVASYDITAPAWFSRWTAGAWFAGCCTTFDAGVWQYFFKGFMDEIKVYPYARTAAQIKSDFASKGSGSVKGTSASLGSSAKNNDAFSNGLVGYWKMDEASWNGTAGEVIDSSGNGNNGTAACGGTCTKPTTGSGKFGNGGVFDGIDDYGSISYTNPVSATSVVAWFKRSGAPAGDYHIITGGGNVEISINESGGGYIRTGVTTDTQGRQVFNSGSGLTDGNWHQVAMTYDGSSLKSFIDGAQTASNPVSGNLSGIAQEIGRYLSNSYAANGKIDEVRIYNRALSPKEVRDLYAWAPGPVAYYNFDEKTGTSLYDRSGNGNSSTVFYGSPTWGTGKFGGTLSFNGSSDYITAGTGANPTYSVTMEAWVKPQSGSQGVVFGKQNSYGMLIGTNIAKWVIWGYDWITYPTIPSTSWSHVAFIYDYNTQIRYVYVNGVQTGSTSTTVTLPSSGNQIGIGRWDASASEYFNGPIDDLRIYNYARTNKQIVEDMNAGHPVGGSPVGSQVGYWKFDEGYSTTVNNSGTLGSSGNGTMINSPVWSQSGKFGKAINYSQSNDYVTLGGNSNFVYSEGEEWTSTLWFKTSTSVTGINGGVTLLSKGTGNAIGGYSIGIGQLNSQGYDNKIHFVIDKAPGNNYAVSTNSLPTVNDGNWHYVAVVYDAKNNTNVGARIYFDGVNYGYVASGVAKASWATTSSYPLTAGAMSSVPGTSQNFTGLVDEVKIYNSALTEDEIKLDYNAGSALGVSVGIEGDTSDNPNSYWKFDEGQGTTAYDSGTNGINATVSSSDWTTGKINGAINFGSSINVGDQSALEGQSKITIEAWVYPTALAGTDRQIVHKGEWTDADMTYRFMYQTDWGSGPGYPNGYWWLYIKHDGDNVCSATGPNGDSASRTNMWQHIAGTWDGSNIKFYVNGVLTGTNSCVGTALNTNAYPAYLNYNFPGKVDELKIYNYARSSTQIAADAATDVLNPSLPGAPVGEWKFDEKTGTNAYDTSGNGYVGTITSGTWTQGKIGSALDFNGSSSKVSVGTLTGKYSSALTVEAWVNHTSTADWDDIVAGGCGDILFGFSSNQLNFGGQCNSPFIPISYTTNINGAWHHVAGVYNGSYAYLYVDGQLVNSAAKSGSFTPGALYIGSSGTTEYYYGKIDHVKVYDYARTPAQVAYDYNRGGPVGWWKMDECQGGTANDASGNANNGTITIGASGSQTAVGTCTTSGTAWYNGVTGKYNSSLNFDGTDDYVDLGTNSLYQYNLASSQVTWSAWVKTSSSSQKSVLTYGTTYNPRIAIANNYIDWYFTSGGVQSQTGNLSNGNWHHIVVVNNNLNLQFYIDGIAKGTGTSVSGTTGDQIYVGKKACGGCSDVYFSGQIDDVKIFNYALTATQVKTLYNQGSAIQFAPATGNP